MKDNRGESRYENWYVLQVRTNKEKFVLDFINRMMENKVKIMTFMKDIIHTRSNRDIKWEIPLFPGYIFVHKIYPVLQNFWNPDWPMNSSDPSSSTANSPELIHGRWSFCCRIRMMTEKFLYPMHIRTGIWSG